MLCREHGSGTSAAFGADKSCSAPGVQCPGCLHPCQTAPAWEKGELLTPWCGFAPFSQVQTCWNREVRDGAGSGQVDAPLLKNPLAPEARGCCSWHHSLPGKGRDGGWALHQGPVSCSSELRGSGAAKESVILLSIISGTSYAQTLIPVLTADGRSHPRGCLIGTLKIKSQVLIAALGNGACNSGMLGSDFSPPEHCIGDTNICGASWVCAVTLRCCFTPASGEGPSQGRKKSPGRNFSKNFPATQLFAVKSCVPSQPLSARGRVGAVLWPFLWICLASWHDWAKRLEIEW